MSSLKTHVARIAVWSKDQPKIMELRRSVFIVEQGVPEELELDGLDEECVFVVAEDSITGDVIGTGRLRSDGHIGRLAVAQHFRGRGIGAELLAKLMEIALERGYSELDLNAQEHALGFYQRFGFVEEGKVFLDAGIRHLTMRRRL